MIALIFLLALALRIYATITPAIWYDEAFTLHIATLPVAKIVAMRDFTPPLWEFILHPFVMLSPSVYTIRIVALVLSMLTLYLAWLITRALKFTREQTLISLFIIATLPGMIWMGTDGRVYALLTCLYTLGIYAAVTDRRTLLFVASIGVMYLHATGLFLVIALYFYWFIAGDYFNLTELFVTGAGLFALWLPWWYPYLNLGPSGLFVPMSFTYFIGQWTMANFIGAPQLAWLIGSILLISTALQHSRRLHATLVFLPLLLILLASFLVTNLITYRTLSPTLVPFALLVAKHYNGKLLTRLNALAWILLLTFATGTYDFAAKGSQQAQAAQMLLNDNRRIVYASLGTAMPFEYYLKGRVDYCVFQMDGWVYGEYGYGFNFPLCGPADLQGSYWFIFPVDPVIPSPARAQMDALMSHGDLALEYHPPQFAPIQLWRIEQ